MDASVAFWTIHRRIWHLHHLLLLLIRNASLNSERLVQLAAYKLGHTNYLMAVVNSHFHWRTPSCSENSLRTPRHAHFYPYHSP